MHVQARMTDSSEASRSVSRQTADLREKLAAAQVSLGVVLEPERLKRLTTFMKLRCYAHALLIMTMSGSCC